MKTCWLSTLPSVMRWPKIDDDGDDDSDDDGYDGGDEDHLKKGLYSVGDSTHLDSFSILSPIDSRLPPWKKDRASSQ